MKRVIYFTDKKLCFSTQSADNYDLTIESSEDISRAKIVDFFEKYNSILVLCDDDDQAYEEFCREFTLVNAAGGVVVSPEGRTLLIFRNGRWDLPKGHVEEGESTSQCALREVEEETGVQGLELGVKRCKTLHAYYMHERWEIKSTHWYDMMAPESELKPQTEEGIERVEWFEAEQLPELLKGSFPTIRDVFEAGEN